MQTQTHTIDIGDAVFIELSAEEDVGFMAWPYVKEHLEGIVRGKLTISSDKNAIEQAPLIVYAVEWPVPFQGGIDCQGLCAKSRGQFITSTHVSLRFEASRDANTVPLLGMKPEEQ